MNTVCFHLKILKDLELSIEAFYKSMTLLFFYDFIYLFLERGEAMERGRKHRENWLPLSCP